MTSEIPSPPYDPELVAAASVVTTAFRTAEEFDAWRSSYPGSVTLETLHPLLTDYGLVYEEREVPVVDEGRSILLSIVRPADSPGLLPAVFDIHGGGMVVGTRLDSFVPDALRWAADHRLAIISPEYTLAPAAPAPRAALECFAAAKWVAQNAVDLGIDAHRIILAGVSGGGAIAASVALLARDNGGPDICAQLLLCPQLGDRHDTVSSRQFSLANGATDTWPLETNRFAWDAILGAGHEKRDISIYASPARAVDLRGLPPAFIDAGANEVFRDASVAYASQLWASGVTAELHIWPGGYHGFDLVAPTAPVSRDARAARDAWLRRVLNGGFC